MYLYIADLTSEASLLIIEVFKKVSKSHHKIKLLIKEAKRVGVHQTDFVTAKINPELFPLLVVYNAENTAVILQISDLNAFFGKKLVLSDQVPECVSVDEVEALLYKSKIITDWSSQAKEIAEHLPIIDENGQVDDEKVKHVQSNIGVYEEREEGLESFSQLPLVSQFNELFKLTEDPLGRTIKSMETQGDDKYANFNPKDIVFFDDALVQDLK